MVSPSTRVLRPLLAVGVATLVAHGAAFAAAGVAAVPAAAASSTSSAKTSTASADGGQRNKMKTCNAEAKQKDLHKAERREFMKQCLSKGSAA